MSVAGVEQTILDEGTALIWVLAEDQSSIPGTAEGCRQFVAGQGSAAGICVGDGETQPAAGVFHNSGFADGRGFDMVVERASMKIIWTASHGTPSGNDNLSGDNILDQLRELRGQ